MIGRESRPMARTLAQGSEDRFAVEARETSDMLRQGDPAVIVGANGTRMMAYALPAKQSVSGEFPKVTPSGRFRSSSPVAEVTGSDAKMMTDSTPVIFHNKDGATYRIRGHRLPDKRNPWTVTWAGGRNWICRGGVVQYEFEGALTEFEVPKRNGPDVRIPLSSGWIVLQMKGSQHDPAFYGSHFVPNEMDIVGVDKLAHNFIYTIANNPAPVIAGTSSAGYGMWPIAWVGVVGGKPIIFPSYYYQFYSEVVGLTPAPILPFPFYFNSTLNPEDHFYTGS